MTQIELEARLAQMEADYSARIRTAQENITNIKIQMERIKADKELHLCQCKQEILNHEHTISNLKQCRLEAKAKIFAQFEDAQRKAVEQADTL